MFRTCISVRYLCIAHCLCLVECHGDFLCRLELVCFHVCGTPNVLVVRSHSVLVLLKHNIVVLKRATFCYTKGQCLGSKKGQGLCSKPDNVIALKTDNILVTKRQRLGSKDGGGCSLFALKQQCVVVLNKCLSLKRDTALVLQKHWGGNMGRCSVEKEGFHADNTVGGRN